MDMIDGMSSDCFGIVVAAWFVQETAVAVKLSSYHRIIQKKEGMFV
jgi:hypothetical protein